MNTFKYTIMLALACSLTASCMDGDWDEPQLSGSEAGIGNNAIQETNVVTIKQLKEQYQKELTTDYRVGNSYAQITEDMQIKAVVTGNDIQGNLYNEIAVDDGTGAIIIAIGQGGLFGTFPVGAEILVDLKGLHIGNYGKQATIGSPYTNSNGLTYVSRMSRLLWDRHFKLTGSINTVEPIVFNEKMTAKEFGSIYEGKLVTLQGVTFKGANGTATYANAGSGAGSKSVYFKEYPQSLVMLYTSNYADFAANPLPTGMVNVTGIMKRFNDTWEIVIRTLDDVEIKK